MKPTPSARRPRSFILARRRALARLRKGFDLQWTPPNRGAYYFLSPACCRRILAPPRGAGVTARSIARSMVLVFVLALVLAARPNAGAQRQGPQPVPDPAQGDGGVSAFYTWDRQVPATPGRLLRQEPLPEHLLLENASKGLRVLYTSTDGVGGKTPIAASGAVFVPKGPAPAGGWPIIAWAHGTTGVADVCAPSWAPRSKRDTDYLNAWLAQGYAVVAADYQGLGTPGGHPWMSGRSEGWSVLDGVRAALGAFPQLANTVVIVGQSQGAHAALSAALLAKAYAPAINVKSTVATGVPGPQSFVRLARQGSSTVLLLMLYRGMADDRAFRPSDFLHRSRPASLRSRRQNLSAAWGSTCRRRDAVQEDARRLDRVSCRPLSNAPLRSPGPDWCGTRR